jgi:tetratricopeptide (TPR) repeat protein
LCRYAWYLEGTGRIQEAKEHYCRALDIDPDNKVGTAWQSS